VKKRDLQSIKFETGDLVRLATYTNVSLGIVLRQNGMEVIVKWVIYPSLTPHPGKRHWRVTHQTVYSLEKLDDEGEE